MPNISIIAKRLDHATATGLRVFFNWLFGDLVFAVLPLFVLVVITNLMHRPFEHFLELKEWSFASIVLYGVLIRRFIYLKVRLQQTPRSFTLDGGVQLYVVLLIAAVLVLALVVLAEMGAIPAEIHEGLGHAQFALFGLAAISLFAATAAEDASKFWVLPHFEKSEINWRFVRRSLRDLSDASSLVEYVSRAFERVEQRTEPFIQDDEEVKRQMQRILLTLDQLEAAAAGIRRSIAGKTPHVPSNSLKSVN